MLILIKNIFIGGFMADTLKNKSRFSTTLEHETLQMLKDYSKKTFIPISIITNQAIIEYIKKRTQ